MLRLVGVTIYSTKRKWDPTDVVRQPTRHWVIIMVYVFFLTKHSPPSLHHKAVQPKQKIIQPTKHLPHSDYTPQVCPTISFPHIVVIVNTPKTSVNVTPHSPKVIKSQESEARSSKRKHKCTAAKIMHNVV